MKNFKIETAALDNIVELGDESLLKELVDLFEKQTPLHLENIKNNIKNQNAAEISRIAHTLKSSCRYLGAFDMADTCVEFEEWARQETPDFNKANELLQVLSYAYESAIQQLRDFRKTHIKHENSALF